MRGQIGCWGYQVTVGFGDEMLDWLDAFGTNRYVSISCTKVETFADLAATKRTSLSRSFSIHPVAKGEPGARRVSSAPHNAYKRAVKIPFDEVGGFEALYLPRFELHEVEFGPFWNGQQEGVTEMASCAIEDDHLLPWPRLHKDCDLYACAEVMESQLKQRMLSYVRAGQVGQFLRPPQRLIDSMASGAWARIMREVKQECGVS